MNRIQNLLLIIFLLSFAACKAQPNTYDSFETQNLSNIWSSKKLSPHALEIQSSFVRSGQTAAKITLNTGNMYEFGNDTSKASERAELVEAKNLESIEGLKYAYSFSILIPKDFPIVATRLIIAQWKQRCEQDNCQDRSPVIAIRYESGNLFISLQTANKKQILYKIEEDIRNKWLDFTFKIKFTRTSDGEITASLNNKNIISYSGVTSYSEQYGFPEKSSFYFKMGLYRDTMAEPMTIYLDEYRKNKISE